MGRCGPDAQGAFFCRPRARARGGAALILSNQLYKYNPLSKVMIFSLLSPVLGVFSSAVMLGDSLRSGYVFANLMINCAGVALATTEQPPRRRNVGRGAGSV